MTLIQRAALAGLALVVVAALLTAAHGFLAPVDGRSPSSAGSVLPTKSLPSTADQTAAVDQLLVEEAAVEPRRCERSACPARFPTAGEDSPAGENCPACDWPKEISIEPSSEAVVAPEVAGRSTDSAPKVVEPNPRDRAARRLIEKELGDSSAEDREVWHEALKDMAPNDLRELLRLRQRFGRLPELFPPPPTSQPPRPLRRDPRAVEGEREPSASGARRPEAATMRQIFGETRAAIAAAREIIADNIANLHTAGFRRRVVLFESAVDVCPWAGSKSSGWPPGATTTAGCGARLMPPQLDTSPGKLRHTGRPLDLAIDGPGFFQLKEAATPRFRYTRCGHFTTNDAGEIVLRTARADYPLEPALRIPASTRGIEVGQGGEVRIRGGGEDWTLIGRIPLAGLSSAAALVPLGENLYEAAATPSGEAKPTAAANLGRLRQGELEESNVEIETELQELQRLKQQEDALEKAAALLPLPVSPGDLFAAPKAEVIDRRLNLR